jgi:hypothetical protein
MQITLAQALKENNRIAGEIARAWNLIEGENSKREDIRRIADVKETYDKVMLYTEKLVELKSKIGVANAENLGRIYRMEECKSILSHLDDVSTDETSDFQKLTESNYKEFKKTVVFNATQIWELKQKFQKECNRLQDEMDAYNAAKTIDFDSPLEK